MRTDFPDHFSGHAEAYARHRPHYPAELYRWLAKQCRRRELAWDAGSGNGQAAVTLAGRFDRVVAGDASLGQLREAAPHDRVLRVNERAEACSLRADTVDLVTVAQAAHWFRLDAFFGEVRRVARPGAVVAIWCYGLTRVSPEVDELVWRFYDQTLGDDWPPERRHIETGYRELAFPFQSLPAPEFQMEVRWTAAEFCDYLGTWSAYRRHCRRTNRDPMPSLQAEIAALWGDSARSVHWPIHLRAGKVHDDRIS